MILTSVFGSATLITVAPSPQNRFPNFDQQASTYDRRAGLPPRVVAAVAAAIAVGPDELLVEVGAGTGQIGARVAVAGGRYVGLDRSVGMLAVFSARLRGVGRAHLLRADCDLDWPLASGVAHTIFSSRAIHLLDPDHAAREALRVAHPEGSRLLIGRVRRREGALHEVMKRELHRRLAEHDFTVGDPQQRRQLLLRACCEHGGELIQPQAIARWSVSTSPQRMLRSWSKKPGLAGGDPPSAVKRMVLDELARWAKRLWGDADRRFEEHEEYYLEGARLPPVVRRDQGLPTTTRAT